MKERTFSHIILSLGTSFGFYILLSQPHGFTKNKILGLMLIIFLSWATKQNFDNGVKDALRDK